MNQPLSTLASAYLSYSAVTGAELTMSDDGLLICLEHGRLPLPGGHSGHQAEGQKNAYSGRDGRAAIAANGSKILTPAFGLPDNACTFATDVCSEKLHRSDGHHGE